MLPQYEDLLPCLNPKLTRRFEITTCDDENSMATTMFTFFEKFSNFMEDISVTLIRDYTIPQVGALLENRCANLKSFKFQAYKYMEGYMEGFDTSNFSRQQNATTIMRPCLKSISLTDTVRKLSDSLKFLAQQLIYSAPNLQHIELPINIYPDLSNCGKFESVEITTCHTGEEYAVLDTISTVTELFGRKTSSTSVLDPTVEAEVFLLEYPILVVKLKLADPFMKRTSMLKSWLALSPTSPDHVVSTGS